MTDAWLRQLAGRFVVFDGPDGSGKSTQFRRFVQYAQDAGLTVTEVREPGGTEVGERIRQLLLDPTLGEEMDVRCEMMLYMASRAQLVAHKIAPAKAAGHLVLADRFISSTLAYQGTAGGLAMNEILEVGKVAIGEHWPDVVVIFDVDQPTAAARLNPLLDRMEQKGEQYHARVRQGYRSQAEADPARHLVLDARPDADTVFAHLCRQLPHRFDASQ